MTIKQIISKIIFDYNEDPAFYRIIFKHHSNVFWDVPFNYLNFQNGYFTYNEDDTIFPLHRIVAIYNQRGEYLLKRKFDSEHIIIKPSNIMLYPGVKLEAIYSEFQIARYAWIILRQLEESLDKNFDDVLDTLGTKFDEEEHFLILTSKSYFYGTVIDREEMKIYRGNRPIAWGTIEQYLHHQRIYQYGENLYKLIHFPPRYKMEITLDGNITIKARENKKKYYSLLLTRKNKLLSTINQKTKMLVHPNLNKAVSHVPAQIKAITTKEWIHIKGTAIITDYDSIIIHIE